MISSITAESRKNVMTMLITQDIRDTLLIDSYDGAPINMEKFRVFNPFFTWPSAIFPVPGMPGKTARSIESIWQGTKWLQEKYDEAQFQTIPYKRPSEAFRNQDPKFNYNNTQFFYEKKIINQLEARFLIYCVAYLDLLNNKIPEHIIQEILATVKNNQRVIFYDWDSNMDITNISESFSHSAILAAWFRGSLEEDFLVKAKETLSENYYAIFSTEFHRLTTRYNQI